MNTLLFSILILLVLPSCYGEQKEDLATIKTKSTPTSSTLNSPTKASPLITDSKWGETTVEGFGTFEDVTLWPGGAKEWDFKRKTCPIIGKETGHYAFGKEGIMPFEIRRLAKKGAEYIIVSRGRDIEPKLEKATTLNEYLKIKNLPKDLIESWNLGIKPVNVLFLPTQEAIEKYNELAKKGMLVGAIIHSTC